MEETDTRAWAEEVVDDNLTHPDVRGYLRDEDAHPDWRYCAVDSLYDAEMGEYDRVHGKDDPSCDMEVRSPMYAALHDALCDLWERENGKITW